MSQLYNMFPRLLSWIKNRQLILKNVEMTVKDVKDLTKHLKETLDPHICRGLVDCFLIRKQKEEVWQQLWCFSANKRYNNASQVFFIIIYSMVLFLLGLTHYRHSLPWEELDIYSDQSVCCWYWHHSNYTEMGFAAYGQISTNTR